MFLNLHYTKDEVSFKPALQQLLNFKVLLPDGLVIDYDLISFHVNLKKSY